MKRLSVKNKKNGLNNEAVSPVVGVMLMLVVTIIVAAVVSAFAGGLTESTSKAPQVSLKATYSQTDGLAISHQGGDTIGTIDTVVIARLSDTFGDASHMAWTLNASTIVCKRGSTVGTSFNSSTKEGAWLTNGGMSGVKSFAPGDNAYIEPPYHTNELMQPGAGRVYKFDDPDNIGKTFWLEFADKSGKTFAKTEVKIAP
ncbi:MAG: type IV pilin N-terminal domain-containing protein [Methanomicrobium sp.]|nr:type IV pilin N-terminal domain-containing protein [Methanomicrobium sp.]